MQPGFLVTGKPTSNSHVACFRMYSTSKKVFFDRETGEVLGANVVDKFYHGETGIVIDVDVAESKVCVLGPRGLTGWLRMENVQVVP